MRSLLRIFLVCLSLPALSACSKDEPAALQPTEQTFERIERDTAKVNVIYGDDNRHEVFAEKDASVRALTESTVALIKSTDIGEDVNGVHAITAEKFGTKYGLCSTERFNEQHAAAFCSGFLIAPNLIATAGHCVRSALDCSETSFVFDYAIKNDGAEPVSTESANLYRCKSVVHSETSPLGADFAILEVDREVVGRRALPLRQSGDLELGEDLTVIGHPTGLPTKISDGAKVRSTAHNDYFVANLDTYGGNSGSAVFNSRTQEVEGILVRGENDFVWSPQGCSVSYVCQNDGCRGEDVTKISVITGFLSFKTGAR